MDLEQDADELGFDLGLILSRAMSQIVEHEDWPTFRTWLYAALPRFVGVQMVEGEFAPKAVRALATGLGRAIWNATPLPGNRFRTVPVARPGRDGACPCGSQEHYRHCCGAVDLPLSVSEEMIWPYLLDALPPRVRHRSVAAGQVPPMALAQFARGLLEEGQPDKAPPLLEPLFRDSLQQSSPGYAAALDALLDAYDEMGRSRRKDTLLRRVIDEAPRSPLRSAAWQRMAAIATDHGDSRAAWDAFNQAQRDDPDAPGLAFLEIFLLMQDDQRERVRERARYWIKRLQKKGFAEGERPLDWLQALVDDPGSAYTAMHIESAGGSSARLLDLVAGLDGQELPRYELTAAAETRVAGGRCTGASPESAQDLTFAAESVGQLRLELPRGEREPPAAAPRIPAPLSMVVAAPRDVADFDVQWRTVFDLEKPLALGDKPITAHDPWCADAEERWCGFLAAYPRAFDSLEVLDDIATALRLHPCYGVGAWEDSVLMPVLARARAIVERALADSAPVELRWSAPSNRAVLRCLARITSLEVRRQRPEAAARVAQLLLELNPRDEHGVRCFLMNRHLAEGRDAQALELAKRYPNDPNVELAYGTALARYRAELYDEAEQALGLALHDHPRIKRCLLAERYKRPPIDRAGVTHGGEDEAWLYRMEMRSVWQSTAGAMAWLSAASKRNLKR